MMLYFRLNRETTCKTSIYYVDETQTLSEYVNVNKVWTDTSVLTVKQAFVENLSTGLKNPSGRRGKNYYGV